MGTPFAVAQRRRSHGLRRGGTAASRIQPHDLTSLPDAEPRRPGVTICVDATFPDKFVDVVVGTRLAVAPVSVTAGRLHAR